MDFKQFASLPMSAAVAEPQVEILIQPKQHGQRFRYKCESRSAGSLIGDGSTVETKTFPTVEIKNLNNQSAIIVVSCVTRDPPYQPHPHNLVGTNCKDGVCTMRVKPPQNTVTLNGVGIQCCKRNEVTDSLKTRSTIRVNPYGTPPPEKDDKIDLSVVRLCFQAFLPDQSRRFTRVLAPVVTQPIIDKKTVHDLIIVRLSLISGSVNGGDDMIILCEKVKKEDIQVRFFQQSEDGEPVWEAYADINSLDVHHQYAICFKTPAYRDTSVVAPVQVSLQLVRPSTNEVGDPKPFMYRPADHDPDGFKAKRRKTQEQKFTNFLTDFPGARLPHQLGTLAEDGCSNNVLFGASNAVGNIGDTGSRPMARGIRRTVAPGAMGSDYNPALPSYSFSNIGAGQLMDSNSGRYIQDDLFQASSAAGIFPPTSLATYNLPDGMVFMSTADPGISSLDPNSAAGLVSHGGGAAAQDICQGQDLLSSGGITSGDLMQILGGGSLMEMHSEDLGQLVLDGNMGVVFQQFGSGTLDDGSNTQSANH